MKYESLAELIEPYADGPFSELPEGLGERAARAFSSVANWDDLAPNRRRLLARQRDNHDDPANRHGMEYDLALFDEIEKTKTEITNLELRNTPSDTGEKRKELTALAGRLGKLKKLQTLPPFLVEDWKALTDDALAEVVAANTVQAAQPHAAPVAVGASGGDEVWKGMARERAYEIIKRDGAKDLYPSQVNIADEIAKQFRRDGVKGADGKPIAGGYIKRHALKGISSAQSKLVSTVMRRGK